MSANLGIGVGIKVTDKAILVELQELGETKWIPKSVIDTESEVNNVGDHGDVVVATWWARKEGLE